MSVAVVLIGLAGLVVGIGLTVLIDRVPARERLLPLRFHCPRCPGARDLRVEVEAREEARRRQALGESDGEEVEVVPSGPGPREVPGLAVASMLLPRRPCPGCAAPLGARYWGVPWATAAVFAVMAAAVSGWALPAHLVLAALLVTVTVIDLELRIIPTRLVYPALLASVVLLGVAAAAEGRATDLTSALLGSGAAWAFLALLWVVSPASMGFGDVRLALVLGLFLGWQSLLHVLVGIFLGFALAAVVGGVLMALGSAGRRTQVPFGPFLAAGTLAALVWGEGLSSWWGL